MTTMNPAWTRRTAMLPAIGALLLTAACGGGARTADAADAPPRTPTEYVVAVDLSTSLTPTERESHRALLQGLVRELDFGDRLVLLKTHAAGVRDTSTARTVSMPVARGARPLQREREELDFARQTADAYVTSLFRSSAVNGSDLFATLHTAGEQIRTGTGSRKVLVVLSDMLQCTRDVCIEGTRPLPDSAWVAARKRQGLAPSLDGVCVAVVGADDSNARGVGVRDFWRRYFQAAGAGFDDARYVHTASSPSILRCER
jgi:hypothetical protein